MCASVPMGVRAQKITVVKSHDLEPFNQALAGFVASCDRRITEYDLKGSTRRKRSILKGIRSDKPQLVLAIGALAAQLLKDEAPDLPIVYVMVPNPQKYSLQGANIAGISLDIPIATQFERYRQLVPSLHTLGVIYDPAKTGAIVDEASAVASDMGLQLRKVAVDSQKAVPAALRGLIGKIDALWMLPDNTVVTPDSFSYLLLTAFEHHLPFLAASDIFVEVGAFAALSPDYADLGRQACQLTKAIEDGRLSLAQVDVVPPTKINLAINLKTASKIGLRLGSEIIKSADKVYR